MISYGSLLSKYSREQHSGIAGGVIGVIVRGWKRGWCTRYADEQATYAGAREDPDSEVGGVLVPTHVTPDLRHRERHYDLVSVPVDALRFTSSKQVGKGDAEYWICETRSVEYSEVEFPLLQTYVDTCLIGCVESGGWPSVERFICETDGWDHYWVDDRGEAARKFLRAAPTPRSFQAKVDSLLGEHGVLKFRR